MAVDYKQRIKSARERLKKAKSKLASATTDKKKASAEKSIASAKASIDRNKDLLSKARKRTAKAVSKKAKFIRKLTRRANRLSKNLGIHPKSLVSGLNSISGVMAKYEDEKLKIDFTVKGLTEEEIEQGIERFKQLSAKTLAMKEVEEKLQPVATILSALEAGVPTQTVLTKTISKAVGGWQSSMSKEMRLLEMRNKMLFDTELEAVWDEYEQQYSTSADKVALMENNPEVYKMYQRLGLLSHGGQAKQNIERYSSYSEAMEDLLKIRKGAFGGASISGADSI